MVTFPSTVCLRELQACADRHAREKPIDPLVGKRRAGPQRRRAGALHDASRLAALADNAPASSECGDPPPLWNTSPLANQSGHGSFPPAVCLRELQACANRHAREKPIHPLVGKRRAGPQRRRAGALHDASRLAALADIAPASSESGGPPPLWNTSPLANRSGLFVSSRLCLRELQACANHNAREKPIDPLVSKPRAGPRRPRTGALRDASPWPALGNAAPSSSVGLNRYGTLPRLPTRAAMVRFHQPSVCASRKHPAYRHVRGKPIHPLVGKRRAGPQRRRAGALHDAGAFPGRPFDFAALRHANWTVLGELSKAGQSGRSFWRFSFKRIGLAKSHLCARGRARSETLRQGQVLGERGTVFGVRWPSTALEHFPACQPERPWFVSSNRFFARAASLHQSPRSRKTHSSDFNRIAIGRPEPFVFDSRRLT